MTNLPERPPRTTRPRPAPSAGIDPVDHTLSPVKPREDTAPSAPSLREADKTPHKDAAGGMAKGAPPRRRDVTVQFGTRLSEEIANLIDEIHFREGLTKRQIVEDAVRQTWGSGR